MTITPIQCKAARDLLKWTQEELRIKAKLGRETIGNFEREASIPMQRTLEDLQRAFEKAGISFINDDEWEGVKISKTKSKTKGE